MPETPEELYSRAAGVLRMPPVHRWEAFPFDGEPRPRPLERPAAVDRPRHGEGGVECVRCTAREDEFAVVPPLPERIWQDNLAIVKRGLDA